MERRRQVSCAMIEIPKKEPLNIVPFIDIMQVLMAKELSISTFIA